LKSQWSSLLCFSSSRDYRYYCCFCFWHVVCCFVAFVLVFSGPGVWTQGLTYLLSKQSTTWPTPQALFCFSYSSDRVLHFCLGSASYHNPTYVSTSRITGTHHHILLVDLRWDSQ
jgi:hypothetical protein